MKWLANAKYCKSGYLQWLVPASLPLGNRPRTLALWFRTSQNLSSSTEAALIQYGSDANSQMFGLITSDNAPGKLCFFGYSANRAGSTTLLPNTWYFGAVTFDGTKAALYVNGQLEKSRLRARPAPHWRKNRRRSTRSEAELFWVIVSS